MGKTILISSHILLELADLCDVVGIIEQGQMCYTGPISEIMERARVGLVLNIGVTSRQPDALAFIQGLEGVTGAEIQDDFIRVTMDSEKGNAASVAEQLFKSGFSISRLEEEQVNLETAFMRLTKGLVQ